MRIAEVEEYYDRLEPYYDRIYGNFDATLSTQGEQLNKAIHTYIPRQVKTVLDVACGIGTQSLALAQRNFVVTGTDLSQRSLDRAEREATSRGLVIDFQKMDMRNSFQVLQRQFDIVIACDNAIAHIQDDAGLLSLFKELKLCVAPGGGVIVSIRDYEREEKNGVVFKPYGVRNAEGSDLSIFQTWKWDNSHYDLSMFCVIDRFDAKPETLVMRSRLYAVGVTTLINLFRDAGFTKVFRDDKCFFQPLLIALVD